MSKDFKDVTPNELKIKKLGVEIKVSQHLSIVVDDEEVIMLYCDSRATPIKHGLIDNVIAGLQEAKNQIPSVKKWEAVK